MNGGDAFASNTYQFTTRGNWNKHKWFLPNNFTALNSFSKMIILASIVELKMTKLDSKCAILQVKLHLLPPIFLIGKIYLTLSVSLYIVLCLLLHPYARLMLASFDSKWMSKWSHFRAFQTDIWWLNLEWISKMKTFHRIFKVKRNEV